MVASSTRALCAAVLAFMTSTAVHAATFGATQGSPALAGVRGTLVGPGYDNQGIAFCVLYIAQDPNPSIFIGTNSSSTLYDCTDLAQLPLSDYSFATVETKCLSPTSALILNTPAYVPGFDEKDGDSYCNLLTWDATTLNLTFSSGNDTNTLDCPTEQVSVEDAISPDNDLGINLFIPLDGAQFPDCSGATSS